MFSSLFNPFLQRVQICFEDERFDDRDLSLPEDQSRRRFSFKWLDWPHSANHSLTHPRINKYELKQLQVEIKCVLQTFSLRNDK